MNYRTPEQMGISSRNVLAFYKELDAVLFYQYYSFFRFFLLRQVMVVVLCTYLITEKSVINLFSVDF